MGWSRDLMQENLQWPAPSTKGLAESWLVQEAINWDHVDGRSWIARLVPEQQILIDPQGYPSWVVYRGLFGIIFSWTGSCLARCWLPAVLVVVETSILFAVYQWKDWDIGITVNSATAQLLVIPMYTSAISSDAFELPRPIRWPLANRVGPM